MNNTKGTKHKGTSTFVFVDSFMQEYEIKVTPNSATLTALEDRSVLLTTLPGVLANRYGWKEINNWASNNGILITTN